MEQRPLMKNNFNFLLIKFSFLKSKKKFNIFIKEINIYKMLAYLIMHLIFFEERPFKAIKNHLGEYCWKKIIAGKRL